VIKQFIIWGSINEWLNHVKVYSGLWFNIESARVLFIGQWAWDTFTEIEDLKM
jgi:hypothetical protein